MNAHTLTRMGGEEEFQGEYTGSESAVPVQADHIPTVSLGESGVLTLPEIPAIEAAATDLHEGDCDSLNEKYLLLQPWALENGCQRSGVWRFVYHRQPMYHVDPSHYLTELQHHKLSQSGGRS